MPGSPRRKTFTAKTADYSLAFPADNGVVFTTRGSSGTVIFTLPAVTSALTGSWAEFYCIAAQTMTVGGTAGELVAYNDLTANSVSLQTSSEKIGGRILAECDGTSWLITLFTEETQTSTVAT